MVGCAHDCFRRQIIRAGVVAGRFVERFLRGDSEQQAKMLAQRQRLIAIAAKEFAQSRRRNELNAKMRLAFRQQTSLEGMCVTSRRHDYDRGQLVFPRNRKHFAEPWRDRSCPSFLGR